MIDYAKIDGVNWSTLKHMGKSPLAYRHACDNERPDTKAFLIGRYLHALVFEPEHVEERYAVHDGTFPLDYVVYEGGDRRGKAWEAFKAEHPGRLIFKPAEAAELEESRAHCDRRGPIWAAFERANQGKSLLTESEAKAARGMAAAVRTHPLVVPYLTCADRAFEDVLQWTDKETGILCKARLDLHIRSRRTLIDLKSCPSIDVFAFGKNIARYEYHAQLAHYANGLQVARGWAPHRELFIAVENTEPHDVLVNVLQQDHKQLGTDHVRDLLFKVADCRKSGVWPGRYTEEQDVVLPQWAFGGAPEISFEEENAGA